MAQTWNAGATTFTAIKMNVTDTASAAGSALMDLQLAGTTVLRLQKNGLLQFGGTTSSFPALSRAGSQLIIGLADASGYAPTVCGPLFSSGTIRMQSNVGLYTLGSADDIQLARDAADTLAQRRTTNPQAFRVYNTFTDASNYERGFFRYASNALEIGHEGLGTGAVTPRTVSLWANGTRHFMVGGDIGAWNINTNSHLVCGIDNTRDIGASGANRPRNLYMASWIRMATTVVASLPAAATAGAGARMFVTDALTPAFGSAVTGGGAVTVPVYSTGSAWNVG